MTACGTNIVLSAPMLQVLSLTHRTQIGARDDQCIVECSSSLYSSAVSASEEANPRIEVNITRPRGSSLN